MRQVQIPRHGEPEVLQVIEAADPRPGPGEVRIAVRASGINFADILARMGLYQDAPKPPTVVGYEVAGVIDAVGEGVAPERQGERVLALTRFGGHSSSVVVRQGVALPLPEGMSLEEAAALPVTYLTAHHMLYYLGNLHRGERVLVHSAGGGVGIAAIQLARARDAEIYGTASEHKHQRLREMGVAHCIDYTAQDFEEVIMSLTGGKGVHVALDAVGGRSFRKSYRCLAPNGRLFCFGVSSFAPGKHKQVLQAAKEFLQLPLFHPVRLMMHNRGVFGTNIGKLWDEPEVMQGELRDLLDLYGSGVVAPVVDRTFPLEEAAAAHRYIQSRQNFGKVLLTCEG
jgi:NADPH:quinone reductase-like Zn-dependent oxidoreductase